jgi:serine/threonine protein kinase
VDGKRAILSEQLAQAPVVPAGRMCAPCPVGSYFYTIKLVKGEALKAIIRRLARGDVAAKREYRRPRLLQIFCKICNAIAFAHALGVAHRDLKLENIMLGTFGGVRVTDWALGV